MCMERGLKTWGKAETLLNTPGFVLPAAGNHKMSRQVASLSAQEKGPPHFVYVEGCKVGVEVKCDCPVYRSTPNICQHSLAASEDMCILPDFLQWVCKTKKSSNLSLFIGDSLPKSGGEKDAK